MSKTTSKTTSKNNVKKQRQKTTSKNNVKKQRKKQSQSTRSKNYVKKDAGKRTKRTKATKGKWYPFSCPESGFLEAPLLRQAEGELKNYKKNFWYSFLKKRAGVVCTGPPPPLRLT